MEEQRGNTLSALGAATPIIFSCIGMMILAWIIYGQLTSQGIVDKSLRILPTPTAVLPTATPVPILATAIQDAQVRTGPGAQFQVLGVFRKGGQTALLARSPDKEWARCDFGWVETAFLETSTSIEPLPIEAAAIATPAANANPTATH